MAAHDHNLRAKIMAGERISPEEARHLFSWDLIDLGLMADHRRQLAFPEERVGFILDRIINFTNICEAACRFCAFHAKAGRIDSYEMTKEEILQKVEALVTAGGTQVMLQGGLHPHHTLADYVDFVKTVKTAFPSVYLHSFSPAEIIHIARKSAVSVDEAIGTLKDAGLDSVPGASDLLVARIRTVVSPKKCTVEEWRTVMDALHLHGMKSSATMTYGMGETLDERVEHLRVIREVQDKTGILRAFIPWSFSPRLTDMEDTAAATGVDYLRIVAIGRIFLDNFTHIQAGWLTEGMKLAQIALTMGANDMGGVLMEEVVVKATGIVTKTNTTQLIDIIRNAGKIPAQRDSEYHTIKIFDDGPAIENVMSTEDTGITEGASQTTPFSARTTGTSSFTLAFSPCPNDTLIFHALLHGYIDTGAYRFSPFIEDVETLNHYAFANKFHITKLSFFAFLRLKNHYELLDAGAALGYGCGPLLVGKSEQIPPAHARIAVPGEHTTAHLLLRLWNQGFQNIEMTRFDEILPGIRAGTYDAGVIIHEGRFVYADYGCQEIIDLGAWWESETGLPIPLGCIAIRKDVADKGLKRDIEEIIRRSVRFGLAHREASRAFVKTHSQELDDGVIDAHIDFYVNDFSISLGEKGRQAIEALEEMAQCRRIL